MAGHNYCAERGEGEEDKTKGGIHDAEEGRAKAVWHEVNDKGQRGEPGYEAGGGHKDS